MKGENTYLEDLKQKYSIERGIPSIKYLPEANKKQACKVEKVGKLPKANKAVKIQQKRDNLEIVFLSVAGRERKKAERATAQRNSRRAKRSK